MASMKSIGRLYAPAKLPNFANSPPGVSTPPPERAIRAKFAFRREEAAYTLDRSEIMSTVNADVAPERAGAFAELAQKERLAKAVRRLTARGLQKFSVPPF